MAQMNIDLNRLERISAEDLDDAKTRKRLYQYLYQLSEQLKYWQYHVEEENLTPALQQKLEAAGKENVETKTVTVNDDGITVTDKEGNVTATLSQNGDLVANSVTTGSLTVGGKELGTILEALKTIKIVVSGTRPEGHGILWVEPQQQQPSGEATAAEAEYTATGEGQGMGRQSTVTMTFTRKGNEAATGTKCTYGIRFRARNVKGNAYLDMALVTVTGTNGNNEQQTVTVVNLENIGKYIGSGDMVTVDTLADPSEELANVTHGATVTVSVTLGFSGSGARFVNEEVFTLKCTGIAEEEGGGEGGGEGGDDPPAPEDAVTCTVKYIP